MAPPTWLGLANATGDSKYIDFADSEFWETHDYLFRELPDFAPGGGLFLRDSRFFEPDETGKLIFWGRGNGWVYAGLTSILELLPADHPSRGRCEAASRVVYVIYLEQLSPQSADARPRTNCARSMWN